MSSSWTVFLILFVSATLLFVSNLVSAQTPLGNGGVIVVSSNKSNSNLYHNKLYGISLQYPKNWTASTNGLKDFTDLIAFYTPLDNISDPFPTRLKISEFQYAHIPSLQGYTNETLANFKQFNGTITNAENITLGGNPGYRIVSKFSSPNGSLNIYSMRAWTILENKIYLLSYDGEQSRFNQHLHEVSQIIDSLHFS